MDELDHLLARHFMDGGHIRPQKLLEQSESIGISTADPRFRNTYSKIQKIQRENPGGAYSVSMSCNNMIDITPVRCYRCV